MGCKHAKQQLEEIQDITETSKMDTTNIKLTEIETRQMEEYSSFLLAWKIDLIFENPESASSWPV